MSQTRGREDKNTLFLASMGIKSVQFLCSLFQHCHIKRTDCQCAGSSSLFFAQHQDFFLVEVFSDQTYFIRNFRSI